MDEEKSSTIEKTRSSDIATHDIDDLGTIGDGQTLSRKFTPWSMLALSFSVLGTWATFAVDLSNGLSNGGPITILYGLLLVTLCNLCVALSLGELCSSMPTALGQAYWVSRLWKSSLGRFISYSCAWINVFGWWTLAASQNAFMTEIILGLKTMSDENWTGTSLGWLKFVIYFSITMVMTFSNVIACRKDWILRWFNNLVGAWFGGEFILFSLAILIAVGVKSDLSFQPPSFVFGQWINNTEWSDGVAWFIGLVQSAYGLTAFDAVIHMIEELPSPQKNGPRVLWLSIVSGAVSGGIYMIVCLFSIQSLEDVLDPTSGLPFVELVRQTVGPQGTIALFSIFVCNMLGQGISITTTASRLTWGFARDGGLPFSNYLMHVDSYWKVPARALWAQGAIISLVGLLYFFTDAAVEAVVSVSTIALTISYALPIFAVVIFGMSDIPLHSFSLGRFRPIINWVGLIYCCVTTVFFLFPGSPSPTIVTMNWAIVVFGAMLVVAISFWFTKGNRTYLRTDGALGEMFRAAQLEALHRQ
jgi:choline transport protein